MVYSETTLLIYINSSNIESVVAFYKYFEYFSINKEQFDIETVYIYLVDDTRDGKIRLKEMIYELFSDAQDDGQDNGQDKFTFYIGNVTFYLFEEEDIDLQLTEISELNISYQVVFDTPNFQKSGKSPNYNFDEYEKHFYIGEYIFFVCHPLKNTLDIPKIRPGESYLTNKITLKIYENKHTKFLNDFKDVAIPHFLKETMSHNIYAKLDENKTNIYYLASFEYIMRVICTLCNNKKFDIQNIETIQIENETCLESNFSILLKYIKNKYKY
jgi:hypothetical protein